MEEESLILLLNQKLQEMRVKFTSLSNSLWQDIENKIGKHRKSTHSLRNIIDAILKLYSVKKLV